MCWYVLERYLYCLTNISHLTPEFQKYSLGIGEKAKTEENTSLFSFCCPHRHSPPLTLTSAIPLTLFTGLTPADLETTDQTGNGTTNGVGSDTETEKMEFKEEDKEETVEVTAPKRMLTTFELEGLCNLLGKLEELPAHKKCVPEGIRNPTALLDDMRVSAASDLCALHLSMKWISYNSSTKSTDWFMFLMSYHVFLLFYCSSLFWRSMPATTPSCPTLDSPLCGGPKEYVKNLFI